MRNELLSKQAGGHGTATHDLSTLPVRNLPKDPTQNVVRDRVHVVPRIIRRVVVHWAYSFDLALRRNDVLGSFDAASVSREVQDYRSLSMVWDARIVAKVGYDGGQDIYVRGRRILEASDVATGNVEVFQEELLHCSRVVDCSLEGRDPEVLVDRSVSNYAQETLTHFVDTDNDRKDSTSTVFAIGWGWWRPM